jgi:DNA-binding NarL/FixJ family response regulator
MVVEDHPIVCHGLCEVLDGEADLEVCGTAGTVEQGLETAVERQPDLVIADLSLGEGSGLELIKRINQRDPTLKILVWSMHDENLFASRVLNAGAMGYVNKEAEPAEVLAAVRKVLGGTVYLSREMTESMLQQVVGRADRGAAKGVESLSDRELTVFELIGKGLSTRAIAEALGRSVKTIDSYRENIKVKLDLSSATELIQRATLWVADRE